MNELGGANEPIRAEGQRMMRRSIEDTTSTPISMSATEVLEFRRRIREDGYNSAYVVDMLARRILRSGDL